MQYPNDHHKSFEKMEEKKISEGDENTTKRKAQRYYVDSANGPFRTISEALAIAEPGGIILVNQGTYNESLVITKPNLRILAKEKDQLVYVTSSRGPAVYVEMSQEAKCLFANIRFTFREKIGDDEFNATTNEQTRALELDQFEEEKKKAGEQGMLTDLEKLELSRASPSVIFLESGTLYLQGCQIYLEGAMIPKQSKIALCVAKPDSTLKMLDCEIKGQKAYLTTGCVFRNANITMAICKVHNHRSGGLIIEGKPGNKISLMSNTINQNNLVGVYLCGGFSHSKLKKNEITETSGTGIYCGVGTTPQIMENLLRKNKVGIQVDGADPVIFRNEIKNCFENAVVFNSVGDIGCGGILSVNTIRENEENGVLVKGNNCKPKIDANTEISLCRLAGIKVVDRAHPTISHNHIKTNLAQGILVVESSSAHIIKNDIEENMKANIAFGGVLSGDTVIERNIIHKGRSEGIFMIEGEHSMIINNTIRENMDGILLSAASPLISINDIVDNRRCGIIMVSQCNPKIVGNKINNNYACGVLVRQNSLGIIDKNEISKNYYQISIHGLDKARFEAIRNNNNIEGAYDATMTGCRLL